jgi:hypothetical protein
MSKYKHYYQNLPQTKRFYYSSYHAAAFCRIMPKVNFTVKRVSEISVSVVNVSLFGTLMYL